MYLMCSSFSLTHYWRNISVLSILLDFWLPNVWVFHVLNNSLIAAGFPEMNAILTPTRVAQIPQVKDSVSQDCILSRCLLQVVDPHYLPILSVVVVHCLSHVWLFMTPWTATCRAPLSSTISRSLPILSDLATYWKFLKPPIWIRLSARTAHRTG